MAAVVLAVLLALPASAGLNESEVNWRAIKLDFCLTASGEAFMRALLRCENGRPGFEMGHGDGRHYICGRPMIPDGWLQHAKASAAFLEALQAFANQNAWYRREFCRFFARFYHACDGEEDPKACGKKNESYARTQYAVWKEERHKLNAIREAVGWHPLDEAEVMAARREAAVR